MDEKPSQPKIPPFVTPDYHRNGRPQEKSVSIRGMLSIVTLIASLGSLLFAMFAGIQVLYEIFILDVDYSFGQTFTKVIALGLAYIFGWVMALLSMRMFSNLIMPLVLKIVMLLFLIEITALDIIILTRLYQQLYASSSFSKYVLVMAASLISLVGMHLLIDNHDLRVFSVPLLFMRFVQMTLIVYRYVFTSNAEPMYIFGDLAYFFGMTVIAGLMLAHFGLLNSLRGRIEKFMRQNETSLVSD
jgi:hypothetical protein